MIVMNQIPLKPRIPLKQFPHSFPGLINPFPLNKKLQGHKGIQEILNPLERELTTGGDPFGNRRSKGRVQKSKLCGCHQYLGWHIPFQEIQQGKYQRLLSVSLVRRHCLSPGAVPCRRRIEPVM